MSEIKFWAAFGIAMTFGVVVSTFRSPHANEPASSVYGSTRFSAERKPAPGSRMVSNLTRGTGSAPPGIEERPGGDFSGDGNGDDQIQVAAEFDDPSDTDGAKRTSR